MSQIVTEVYDAFRAANIGEDLARAAAGAIAGREDSVTGLDVERAIGALRIQVGGVEADLKAEIGRVKADLKAEIGRVKADLKAEIGRVEADLKAEIGRVETALKNAIGRLEADMKLLKFGYGPAILGLLIKLVFFP